MSKSKQPRIWTTKTYDKLSRYYDTMMRTFFPLGEKGREKVAARLEGGSVLDVACGTGTLLKMVREKGLDCYGIDLSEGMLKEAKRKVPEAEFKLASFYEIPYPDQSFDAVAATNALSGVQIDAEKVISEMVRVCKKGGRIYLAEWPKARQDTLSERIVIWFASLTDDAPKDYCRILRDLGFEPEMEVLGKHYAILSITR